MTFSVVDYLNNEELGYKDEARLGIDLTMAVMGVTPLWPISVLYGVSSVFGEPMDQKMYEEGLSVEMYMWMAEPEINLGR